MKTTLPICCRVWLVVFFACAMRAQTPAPSTPTPSGSDVVKLDAFTVSASDAAGYRAINTVSGTLFKTQLERLPISIQVMTDELLKDIAVVKVEDAIRYTSGVGLANRNEGVGTTERFTIRGFPTGLILRNGVPFTTLTDTVSIERIEVIKGPSGVLFGASDPGGLINYITKQPLPKAFKRIRQTFASYDSFRTELDLNQPLNQSGTLLFRLPAVFGHEASWWRYAWWQRLYANPVLSWTPRPDTRITLEGNFHQQIGIRPRNGTPFLAGFVGLVPAKDLVDGANHAPFLSPDHNYDGDNRAFTVRIDKTLSDTLTVQLIYDQTDLNSAQFTTLNSGPTNNPNPPFLQRSFSASEYMSSAGKTLQLSVVKSVNLRWSKHRALLGFRREDTGSGADLYRAVAENPVKNITIPNPDPAIQYYTIPQKNFDPRVNPAAILGRDYSMVTNAPYRTNPFMWSVFLTDQATFADDRLMLLGGVRYDELRAVSLSRYTPQAGLNYEIKPGLTAYAMYSESFRQNGRSDSRNPNSPYFPPEVGKGLEVGMKLNLLDGRLSGTIALFDITRSQVQVNDGSQAVLGGNVSSLAGEQKSDGLEMDLVYTPTRGLSAILAYAHLNARTTKDKISASSPDANGDGVPDSIGYPNEGASKNSVSLWLRYRVQTGSLKNLGFGLGGQWRQGPIQQFPTANRSLMVQPDDTLRFDASTSYKFTAWRRPIDLQLNVQNLGDKRYWDRRAQFNAPRMYQFTVGTEF